MKINKILLIIAIVSSIVAATNFMPLASADISQTGKDHAQTPGKGVCNADAKIHEHSGLFSSADKGFHKGTEKNFGGPLQGFVGLDSTCQNPIS